MRQNTIIALMVLAVSFVMVTCADAQPPNDAAGPAADNQADIAQTDKPNDSVSAESTSLGGMIVSGGTLNMIFFGILGVFSLWAATVIFERIVNLRRDKLLPDAFAKQLSQIVDHPPAIASKFRMLCQNNSSPVSRIFEAGVTRAGRPLPEVEKAMEDAAAREMAALRAKCRPLNVVGSIAPLVGLLGTVVGMILAFQISSQEGLGKAEMLAEGIYLALMTTAAGLTIAIPCLLSAAWFQARAERYMCDIAECLTTAVPSFAQMEGQSVVSPIDRKAVEVKAAEVKAVDHELTARERFLREGAVK